MEYRSMIVLEQKVAIEGTENFVTFTLALPIGTTWDNCRESLDMFKNAIDQLEKQALERAEQANQAQSMTAELKQ